ncbi:MAG: hypothetical protein EPO35_04585 [Acidobacteria bacterium]|nr:MAG: hypothetical protein EPO35_04585 [Acidobacteriota bacterium]
MAQQQSETEASHRLEEYEVLSEDRREAIHIFVQAAGLATVIIGFGLDFLTKAKSPWDAGIAGTLGLAFFKVFLPVADKCRAHDEKIHARLDILASELKIDGVVPTRYIFDSVYKLGGFLAIAWVLAMFVAIWRTGGLSRFF